MHGDPPQHLVPSGAELRKSPSRGVGLLPMFIRMASRARLTIQIEDTGFLSRYDAIFKNLAKLRVYPASQNLTDLRGCLMNGILVVYLRNSVSRETDCKKTSPLLSGSHKYF